MCKFISCENIQQQYVDLIVSINIKTIRFMLFTPKVTVKLNQVDNYGPRRTYNLYNLNSECRLSVNYGIDILHCNPLLTSLYFKM